MNLTPMQTKLVSDAQAAGYQVSHSDRSVLISKGSKVAPKGIRLYEDGTAHRTDVDHGSALTIRTQKQMRQILGV